MVAAANPSCPKHHRPLPCNTHGRRLQNVNRKCTKAIETECCRPSKRGGGRFTCKLLRSCRTDGQHLWTPLAFFVAGRRFHNFCWVFLCFARAGIFRRSVSHSNTATAAVVRRPRKTVEGKSDRGENNIEVGRVRK